MFLRRFALAVWTMVFLIHIGMYGQQTWNAVRPFITDDARVVGGGLSQIESWMRFDDETAELWVMAATGLTPEFELSIGGVSGVARHADGHSFTFALPLIQGKYLFRPYGPGDWPGIAIAAGTFLPWGSGDLVPPGFGTFAFATFSQCFGEQEDVLIHLNVGANVLNDRTINKTEVLRTWASAHKYEHWEVFTLLVKSSAATHTCRGRVRRGRLDFATFSVTIYRLMAPLARG